MHTKIWWSYVHIRYLVHVQKWTYLALGWPYGWALNFNMFSFSLCPVTTQFLSSFPSKTLLLCGIHQMADVGHATLSVWSTLNTDCSREVANALYYAGSTTAQ